MSILSEADLIAGNGGERAKMYGDSVVNHERIAKILNVFLGDKLATPLTALDCAMMMIGLKYARLAHSVTRDTLIDVAGFAKVADEIREAMDRGRNGL